MDHNGYVQLSKITNGERWEHRAVYAGHHGAIPKGMQVHHRNGVKNDNRIDNLELVTPSQNMQKSDRMRKGYTLDKRDGRYEAYRFINKKRIQIGRFATACGAYMASRMAFING